MNGAHTVKIAWASLLEYIDITIMYKILHKIYCKYLTVFSRWLLLSFLICNNNVVPDELIS